jgi:hypothetical protein
MHVQVSFVTEGNGVGVFKAPPVSVDDLLGSVAHRVSAPSTSSSPSSLGCKDAGVAVLTAGLQRLSIPSKGECVCVCVCVCSCIEA